MALGWRRLSSERAERFLGARRAAGYVTFVSSRSLALPLEYLREVGVAPIPAPAVEGPLDELLDAYRRYLVGEWGLASSTIPEYVRVARWFLSDRMGAGGLALEELSAADVSGFLARECPQVTFAGARNLVGRLRPLLRYLHVAGWIGAPLQWAVPGVADQRDRSLPRGWRRRWSRSCWRAAIVGERSGAGITRSCCCWCDSGSAPTLDFTHRPR
jgi:integrase/recombinase XerD